MKASSWRERGSRSAQLSSSQILYLNVYLFYLVSKNKNKPIIQIEMYLIIHFSKVKKYAIIFFLDNKHKVTNNFSPNIMTIPMDPWHGNGACYL